MKSLATILSLAAVLGTAACANNPNRPTDTGNMAFPTPVQAGNIGTARPATLDTGSMNAPTVNNGGGTLRPSYTGRDTGNMALPPSAQGNSLPK
jgi:hypothetical protein